MTFALLGREGTGLADIKTVGGHPQAQPQCRRWLAPAPARCGMAADVVERRRPRARPPTGGTTPRWPAPFAADRYGLAVLADEVRRRAGRGDPVRGGAPGRPVAASTGADRTSLVAFLRDDHPGALMELLTEFAVRGVNLTRIESRPTGDGLGKLLLLHRLRGPPRRRAGRRGADGPAPGLRRRPVPRQLPAPRRRADPGPHRNLRRRVRSGGGEARPPALRRV